MIPFLVIGYILGKRPVFFQAISLLLTSIVVNYCLKIIFQVPLSPHLGVKGFAFPSGHIQSAFVLYGWLFFSSRQIIYRSLSVAAIIGIGLGLLHFGYHTMYDLCGSFVVSALLLFCYHFLSRYSSVHSSVFIVTLASVALIYILLSPFYKPIVFSMFAALVGFISMHYAFFGRLQRILPLYKNIMSLVLAFFIVFSLLGIQSLVPSSLLTTLGTWFIIGATPPLSLAFMSDKNSSDAF